MRSSVISSSTWFDKELNPSMRLDASHGISLAAIEQGNLDLLRQCFDYLFMRPCHARDWQHTFRKCKTRDEAANKLLAVYGIQSCAKAKIPAKFRAGMFALLQRLLSHNIEQLKREAALIEQQVEQLNRLLEEA
jgi:hypothetical protein